MSILTCTMINQQIQFGNQYKSFILCTGVLYPTNLWGCYSEYLCLYAANGSGRAAGEKCGIVRRWMEMAATSLVLWRRYGSCLRVHNDGRGVYRSWCQCRLRRCNHRMAAQVADGSEWMVYVIGHTIENNTEYSVISITEAYWESDWNEIFIQGKVFVSDVPRNCY